MFETNVLSKEAQTMYIPVSMYGKDIMGVVDTAAQITVLQRSLFEQIVPRPKLEDPFILKGIGKSAEMKAEIASNFKFKIGKTIKTWNVAVADIEDQFILGLDFLNNQGAKIDLTDYSIELNGENIPSLLLSNSKKQEIKVYRAKVAERVVIPPHSNKIVCLEWDRKPKSEMVMQPTRYLRGLLVPNVLGSSENQFSVLFKNPTDNSKTIKKGFYVGTGMEVMQILEGDVDSTDEVNVRRVQIDAPDSPDLKYIEDQLPSHIRQLFNKSVENISPHQAARLAELLAKYESIFAKDDLDIGLFTGDITHKIDTGNAHPIRQKMRRTPLGFEAEEKEHLDQLLGAGFIEPSTSEWASPPVLVRKKDGKLRYCIDFRKLNDVTVKDAFPIANIETCLDTLRGSVFMSTLDMASGYYQIKLDEKDKHKTAFVTKHGLFQYTRLPFGLCNSPATFCRVVQLVLQGLTWVECLAYLDDVIVLGDSFDGHLANLEKVFERFKRYNLKLKPSKCFLFQTKVKFLGKIVDKTGISINPESMEALKNWPVPNKKKEM